jgi:hypothetical protein
MSRLTLLVLLSLALGAVEYDPKPDQMVLYRWETTQSAQWKSAGDDLRYTTGIAWDLAMRCVQTEGPRMTLVATFIKVVATHQGPGTEIRVDSASGEGADDPLLGHLIDLAGKTLTFEVERATGRVLTVSGADVVLAAINARAPAAVPGDPPPLEAQAKAAYGPEALARLWSQILALPAGGTEVALPAPFTSGTMTRTWKDLVWTVALPEGKLPAFELAKDPAPVRGTVSKLSGTGFLSLSAGLPARAAGKLAFTLDINAMTQPVLTVNEINWTLNAQ